MEKLIILLLFAAGSAISTYFQNKRKREEEEELAQKPTRKAGGVPPVPHWPRTTRDWQEEVRRLLGGEMSPLNPPPRAPASPPLSPTAPKKMPGPPGKPLKAAKSPAQSIAPAAPNPLKQSAAAYARAAALSSRVESRLEVVDALTRAHPASKPGRRSSSAASNTVKRWTRDREALREAFIASLIFAPPAALRAPAER